MAEVEGVIKFQLSFNEVAIAELAPLVDAGALAALSGWRSVLKQLGLLGQTPDRYDGYGFGNVSLRQGDGFVISGTQTGGLDDVSLADYAYCSSWDLTQNAVVADGVVKPSSESLSHASIYDVHDDVQCALHVHSPDIWHHAEALNIPVTDPAVAYGTPEMAQEVRRLITPMTSRGVFSMGGHEDGVFTFGQTLDDAGALMVQTLVKAHCVA